jgi:hypothetical protein
MSIQSDHEEHKGHEAGNEGLAMQTCRFVIGHLRNDQDKTQILQ